MCLGDDVADHQEVGDEPHRVDDVQLVGESFHCGARNGAVATQQSAVTLLVQQPERGLIGRYRKLGEDGFTGGEIDFQCISTDPRGVFQGLG